MVGPATAPSDSLRRRVRALHDRLAETYGPPEKPRLDPLDELMLTILSQNTSDTNRDRAYAALRSRFPDWAAVLNAPREEVEEAIRPAGLWQQKARVLQETLASILEDQGELDLSVLDEMSNDEALDYLTGFRGVGIKTAACVLCFA
ncbi:MAG: DNA lyase, partial [Gammaproteobacteria bacterium]|nr:DNA lyase [Gammaproteobacteria bacterium]